MVVFLCVRVEVFFVRYSVFQLTAQCGLFAVSRVSAWRRSELLSNHRGIQRQLFFWKFFLMPLEGEDDQGSRQ